MAIVKPYQVKKEIEGTMYTAQFAGISVALKASDECKIDGTDATSTEKFAEYLFKHVIVEPKGLTPDDFPNMAEFNDVVKFATGVMKGEFRAEADKAAAEAAGKK